MSCTNFSPRPDPLTQAVSLGVDHDLVHIHPTLAEAVQSAVSALD